MKAERSIRRLAAAAVAALLAVAPAGADEERVVAAAEDLIAGRPFVALAEADRLGRRGGAPWRDETSLVAGLAAAGTGRTGRALEALEAVLAADPPSPYHALALAAALDLGRDPRARAEARALASRHLPRLAPARGETRLVRDEVILGAYLRSGRIVLEPSGLDLTPDRPLPAARCSGPAEAALYRAGLLALDAGDAAGAGALLETLASESPYFTYAQHGIARVRLALGDPPGAAAALARLRAAADARGAEGPLRDRASILWAELSRRADDPDGAVRLLEGVDRAGPFAAAAALAGASIRLDAGEPARALAHLAVGAAGSPRLEGRRSLLEAEARLALGDPAGASAALDRGRSALVDAVGALEAVPPARVARLRERLIERAALRARRPWQSERLPAALGALAREDLAPSGLALRVAAWTASDADPLPAFAITHPYDRFAVCGAPATGRPGDPLLAVAFRRLATADADRDRARLLHLRGARERGDARELGLALGVPRRRALEAAEREIERAERSLDRRIRAALAAEAGELDALRAELERALAGATLVSADGAAALRTSGRTSGRRAPSPPR